MIVDAHAHVFLSTADDPARPVDELAPPEREAPIELFERHQHQAGVDGAVLVPLGAEDGYVAGILADRPDRYRGIAVAEPALTAPAGAAGSTGAASAGAQPASAEVTDPGRVAERLAVGGFSGLRFFALPGRVDDDPPWWPVLRRLADDGRVLWLYPRAEDLPTVEEVAARLPQLRILLNHCGFTKEAIHVDDRGRPRIHSPVPQPHEDRVLGLAAFANVAVLLSGAYGFSAEPYPYPDVAGVVGRVADRFGIERLAWASDFPWIVEDPGYRACLELVDHHLPGLSADERAAVLGGTIRRLLDWS